MGLAIAFLACLLVSSLGAIDTLCYRNFKGNSPISPAMKISLPIFQCTAAKNEHDLDTCFLACGLCTSSQFSFGMSPVVFDTICNNSFRQSRSQLAKIAAHALLNTSQSQGYFWNSDPGEAEVNVSLCLTHLIEHMPRRDLQLLFTETALFADFLFEHVRLALEVWPWSSSNNVPWAEFLDYVLPYSFLNEKRDLWWRWRPKFSTLLASFVRPTIMETAKAIDAFIPEAQSLGVLSGVDSTSGKLTLIPGMPITWVSESSPGYMSPQQVAQHGGSCTGTANILAAAFRAVGIPARLAGCSQSVPNDDHHWIEFWDSSTPGPFQDNWHTKEGVSKGNAGGPWDAPSVPMKVCLQLLQPRSQLNTIWSGKWSSSTYLPTLWATGDWAKAWSFVGGKNRCGKYCTAWGCGANNSIHYSEAECTPSSK